MVYINWTLQAKSDLKNIADFIAKDSVKYARIHVMKIRKLTEVLKTHKQIGKVVTEIGELEIRELVFRNYRIIYKIVSENRIDILTIHHSARDLKAEKYK